MSRNRRFRVNLAAAAALSVTALATPALAAPMVLLVGDFNNQTVRRYDDTGAPLPSAGQPAGSAAFAQPPGGVDLTNIVGLATSGNDLYVSSYNTTTNSHVVRFDLTTGAYLNTVVSIPNALNMTDMMVGPDGLLYVGSDARTALLRFTTAGTPMPAPGRPGIADFTGQGFLPRGILHRPQDGLYYMSVFGVNSIYSLDPLTGNATSIYTGFNSLFGETLGPDGNIYFSHDGDVWKYDFSSSTASLFADVNGVFRMDFGPDRNNDGQLDLYHVANDGRVRVADGVTGAALPDFIVSTGGLSAAINLQWVEVPEPASIGFLVLGTLLLGRRRRTF